MGMALSRVGEKAHENKGFKRERVFSLLFGGSQIASSLPAAQPLCAFVFVKIKSF